MKYLTLDQYADLPESDPPYLIHKFIPCPGRILLVGPPKAGKSYLGLQIGLAVAKGEPFMGRPSRKAKVLYLQYDTPHLLWLDRVKKLKRAGVAFDENFVVLDPSDTNHPTQIDIRKSIDDCQYLRNVLAEVEPELVIIDTLRKVASGDENSSEAAMEMFNKLNDIFEKQAVVYIHHTKKLSPAPGQEIKHRISPVDAARGSSFFAGEVDAVYLLYAGMLSTECRFDESTDYIAKKDPQTHFWTFPETERVSTFERSIKDLWAKKKWDSYQAFRQYVAHTIVDVPDHLMDRLEGELSHKPASS